MSSRTDLSQQEVRRIADRLYTSWRRTLGQSAGQNSVAELVDYLKSASPRALVSEELGDRLDEFLAEYRKQRQGQQSSPLSSGISNGINTLMGIVMGRADLSDLDVEKITRRLKQVQRQVGNQVNVLSEQFGEDVPYSAIRADVETYLLNAYPWQLQPHRLQQEFWDVIYDPFADPGLMRQELLQINRGHFAETLSTRGLLTQTEIARVADLLEETRRRALAEVSERYRIEAAKDLQVKIYTFLQETPRDELLSDMGGEAFRSLLEDPYANSEDLQERFTPFGYESFPPELAHPSGHRGRRCPAHRQPAGRHYEQRAGRCGRTPVCSQSTG